MTEVLRIKYKETGGIAYVLPNRCYKLGELVVVKNKKGNRLAEVVCENQDIDDTKLPAEMDVISRAADAKDIKHYQDNKAFAKDSFEAVNQSIADEGH